MSVKIRNARREYVALSCGLAFLVVCAVFGHALFHSEATTLHTNDVYASPSAAHWLGTDALGRDLFARTIVATRISLVMAVEVALIGAVIGIPLGIVIGATRTRAQVVGFKIIDLTMTFPPILIALIVATIIGPGVAGAVWSIGLALAPGFARVAASMTSRVMNENYILAAEILDVPRVRILTRYVGRNIAGTLSVQSSTAVLWGILGVSSLSFLGLGVQPPQFDWGGMLTVGAQDIYTAPGEVIGPAIMICFAGALFGLLGDTVAQSMDVRSRVPPMKKRRGQGRDAKPVGEEHELLGVLQMVVGDGRDAILEVQELKVEIHGGERVGCAVRGVSFNITSRSRVGIVGESGSGKTLLSRAVAGLIEWPLEVEARRLAIDGQELGTLAGGELRGFLGQRVASVFQNSTSSLNPCLRLDRQVTEGIRKHRGIDRRTALREARDLAEAMMLRSPSRLLKGYPHQLSGGMQQRMSIAAAMLVKPSLLIADEPTTGLDVTVQAEVLAELVERCDESDAALLLISHDLAVIVNVCDRVIVMYAGTIVEDCTADELLENCRHPYTAMLIAAAPDSVGGISENVTRSGGIAPSPFDQVDGCVFADRCRFVLPICRTKAPQLETISDGHLVACFRADEDSLLSTSMAV